MTISPENTWLTSEKTYKKCPHCKKGLLDTRTKRGSFVKTFLFFLDLKRYSCSNCGRKVYLTNNRES